jgi:hypothetical protein
LAQFIIVALASSARFRSTDSLDIRVLSSQSTRNYAKGPGGRRAVHEKRQTSLPLKERWTTKRRRRQYRHTFDGLRALPRFA